MAGSSSTTSAERLSFRWRSGWRATPNGRPADHELPARYQANGILNGPADGFGVGEANVSELSQTGTAVRALSPIDCQLTDTCQGGQGREVAVLS